MNHNVARDLRSNNFISKAKQLHPTLSYDQCDYVNTDTPVTIVCPTHGPFQQLPRVHLRPKCKSGCPTCRAIAYDRIAHQRRNTVDEFVASATKVHAGTYDYSKVVYKSTHTKVNIVCPVHGDFYQTPVNHITHMQGCPKCNRSSKGERLIIETLNQRSVEYVKEFAVQVDGRNLRFDFYLPQFNLLVEYDGWQHHKYSSKYHKTQQDFEDYRLRDQLKMQWAVDNKYKVCRFSNFRSVVKDITALLDSLLHHSDTL